jgi:hypothetical protein
MKDLRRGALIGLQTVWSRGRGRLKEQSSGQEKIKWREKGVVFFSVLCNTNSSWWVWKKIHVYMY